MNNEKGFALTELLISIVIIAAIGLGATVSVGQIYGVTRQNNDWATAVQQAQNAGYWISHDGLMANNISGTISVTGSVNISWTDWETGNERIVRYSLNDSPDGLYQLKRNNMVLASTGNSSVETIVANHITGIEFSPAGGTWKLTVTVVSGKEMVTREYSVFPRTTP